MANRPSSIDRLPPAVKEEIGRLREVGHTIDEILDHLRQLGAGVSRSALGRHVKGLDQLGERIRRSREVADALVRRLGDAPESRQARLNIELMHTAILDLFMGAGEGDGEDGEVGGEGHGITLDPMGAMLMAKALDHLTKAERSNVEAIMRIRAEAEKATKAAAAREAETVAKEAGLSAATVEAIKARILGVTLPAKG